MTANLPALIAQSKNRIEEVLPPGHDVDRVVRLARLAVHRNPALLKCDPVSVISAIMLASQLGLEIGRLAHLVPYGSKAQMIPDYKGLIDLATRPEHVLTVQSHVVYVEDGFEVLQGTQHGIMHSPAFDSEKRADSDIRAVYAVAEIQKGGVKTTIHEVMTLDEVNAIKGRSRAKNNGPWVTDFAAMARKTVIKRLCKVLPQNPALGIAVEMDNRFEVGSSSASVPGDTELSIASEMADRARATQERISGQLGAGVEGEEPTTEE